MRGRFLGFPRNGGKGRLIRRQAESVQRSAMGCQIPACGWLLMAAPFRPATHLLHGDGQAKEVFCFFLRFEGCPLALGDLGMDLRV